MFMGAHKSFLIHVLLPLKVYMRSAVTDGEGLVRGCFNGAGGK